MKIIRRLSIAPFILAVSLFAQKPAPNSVQNPASNILPGLPNFGIAQGSIFVVYGSAMGPATIATAPAIPLQTSLAGTSIQVTASGTTVDALIVYTLQSQVAAILPSNTPLGSATLTVTYNGASGATTTQVVKSNFGISTVNQTGTGPAVVTFPNFSVISGSNSAKPGDTLVLWGTGLGPISGSDAAIPTSSDLGTPLSVYVGGVKASVTYRGRSAAPGLDQINFVVPPGITGCYVSLVVQTGNTVSNTTTMAIASGGGNCADVNGLQLSSLGPILNSTGTVRIGVVSLIQETVGISISGNTITSNVGIGTAVFEKYTAAQLFSNVSPLAQPSVGSCTVIATSTPVSTTPPTTPTAPTPVIVATGLDAGAVVSLTPPSGNVVNLNGFAAGGKGSYSGSFSTLPPGAYKISNGSGGADVGAFTANVNVPAALQWTNQAAVTAAGIDRTQPLTLTISGGDPASYAFVEGISISGTSTVSSVGIFVCIAPISGGQVSISPSVLLALPPTSPGSLIPGTLLVGSASNPQLFSVPGLDAAFAISISAAGGSVTFK